MPRSLQACAGKHGWRKIDRVWCTLLAIKRYEDTGHRWVLNPWDDQHAEYDLKAVAWSFLDTAAKDDPQLAGAILEAHVEAEAYVQRWRTEFIDKVERLKEQEVGL
jgi:hypothetical protein